MTKINKEWFKNVIIFSLSEPGAMGIGGLMDFITADGGFFKQFFIRRNTMGRSQGMFPCFEMLLF